MTIAHFCVLAAALMPYLFVTYAKASREYLTKGHNRDPRKYLASLEGSRHRAGLAQLNAYEAFPPFLAGVLIAGTVGAPQSSIDLLALVFVGARLVYGLFYILDWHLLRSTAWMVGMGSVLGLFVVAAGA
jgi:uncharacterized MAPEG superfamily protein